MGTHSISGLVIVSEGERLCYPYLESVKSMLPVVDEMVVVYNRYKEDESYQKLKDLGVRMVPCVFDIDLHGWTAYAIARSLGYQACTGDVVAMFDADGVLHEKQQQTLRERLNTMTMENPIFYWGKHRFYTPSRYWPQNKHSGIYYKKELGDDFHFWADEGKGVPCTRFIPFEFKTKQIDVTLFGYEHIWDTKEVLLEKITRYSAMLGEKKPREEIYKDYVGNLKNRLKGTGKTMNLQDHPKIVQDRLNSIEEKHFGFSLGDNWDAG